MLFPMVESDRVLVRIADLLDSLEMNQGLAIQARSVEQAFGGTGATNLSNAEAFARAHGCVFEYDCSKEQGLFTRAYPKGGRA
ncbi:hypothetical protein [Bradyrhizobium centrosematis]|uniref:hypothetical protein n=1 Tax=Bradyrhizobium centrosematis TaxID=1300039 RepID=UPI0021670C32|nr:hypothetical protein [Bradyrhizobium centrosematis]MCS3758666.1 hypothetical protein [Bradyrhizobium centrosematis]MCS3773446.1 hypothetical protein [Bradyrhizobium centrosematis]